LVLSASLLVVGCWFLVLGSWFLVLRCWLWVGVFSFQFSDGNGVFRLRAAVVLIEDGGSGFLVDVQAA
jgi:hypothetical protein